MSAVKSHTRAIDGGRHYRVQFDGHTGDLPSVNTLKGMLASGALEGWKQNNLIAAAHEAAGIADSMDLPAFKRFVRSQAFSDTSALDLGNAVHEVAEAFFEAMYRGIR